MIDVNRVECENEGDRERKGPANSNEANGTT